MQDISLAIAKGDSKALVALVALGFSEKDAQDYIAKQTEVVVPKLIGVDSGEAPAAGSPFMIDKDGKKRAVATPPFETNMTQALDKEQERLKSIRESDPNHPKPKPPQTSDESYQEAAAKNQQLGGNGANLAILLEENKKTAQAGEGLRSADIGVPTATGISLYKHKQHENLRDKNEGPVREDGLITKRISLLEMSFLSDIAMNGNEFVDDDKAAHATARARVKKALDIDGDGIVQVEEIDKAKQALQHAGVIMEVDAEALATTLNTGKLPQKQRDIR